jgi:hypothetical protein
MTESRPRIGAHTPDLGPVYPVRDLAWSVQNGARLDDPDGLNGGEPPRRITADKLSIRRLAVDARRNLQLDRGHGADPVARARHLGAAEVLGRA